MEYADEGKAAFWAGRERDTNPYIPRGMTWLNAAREWYRGYDEARTESYRNGGSTLQNKARECASFPLDKG